MVFKNLLRIVVSYKFHLITIIFFELLYLIKGYKGNRFNFRKNEFLADNIPCPYYFLLKIKKFLKKNNFYKFLASLIEEGLKRGHTIECWHDYIQPREGMKYYLFP